MPLKDTFKLHFIFKTEFVLINILKEYNSEVCPFLRTPQDNFISSGSEEVL